MGQLLVYKNFICLSLGLLIIFLTSFFVCENYFNQKIDELIQKSTLLKDYHYPTWGQQPNPLESLYRHTFTLPESQALQFDYTFKYSNISFSQGNSGFIRYLNHWSRKLTNNTTDLTKLHKTLNPAVQKIYSYDYLAPQSRKFVLAHNALNQAIKTQFLPKFYAEYLYRYYFLHKSKVIQYVLTPAGLTPDRCQQIYNNENWGMSNPKSLSKWLQVASLPNPREHAYFEDLQLHSGLTLDEMLYVLSPTSTMKQVVLALNGTIKYRMETKQYDYQDGCDPICSDEELVDIQLVTGLLTNEALMNNISLSQLSHVFNGTWKIPVEYLQFCRIASLTCISKPNVIGFFRRGLLSNFTVMSEAFKYKDEYNIIESIFGLEQIDGTFYYGQSIIKYVEYLQKNLYDQFGAYQSVSTNYRHFSKIMLDFKDVLYGGLVSRSMEIKFRGTPCEQYYQGRYTQFVKLCANNLTNLQNIASIRFYLDAHLFKNRQQFLNVTGMSTDTAAQFLKIDSQSLFVTQLRTVKTAVEDHYKFPCTPEDLAAREWGGSQGILTNLPSYFPMSKARITEWDTKHVLKDYEPQYRLYNNSGISLEQSLWLLDPSTGLGALFSLIALKGKNEGEAQSMLQYVQQVVLQAGFGGAFEQRSVAEWANGYKSVIIADNKKTNSSLGGTPWMEETIYFVQLNHQANKFSAINTGIYDTSRLRSVTLNEGLASVGSYYTVFQSKYENVIETLPTKRPIQGTSMLGFRPDLSTDDRLTAFLEVIQTPLSLDFQSTVTFQGFEANRYRIKNVRERISLEQVEQTQRFLTINASSYMIVEPITGLSMEFKIDYSVTAKPFYLEEEILLYECQVRFERGSTSDVKEIHSTKDQLRTFYLCTVILSATSMLLVVISLFLYCRKRRDTKKISLMDSLMREEGNEDQLII